MHRCGERSRGAHRDRCRSVKRRPRMSAGGTASTLSRTARWGELISLCFIDATAIGQMRYPLITGVWATSTPGLAAGTSEKLVPAVAVYVRRVLQDSGICSSKTVGVQECQLPISY